MLEVKLPLLNDQPWAEGSQPDGASYECGGVRVEYSYCKMIWRV